MAKTFNIWKITSYKEYKEDWPAIPGEFDKLTDYQKSLGYKTPEEFFDKQAYAAQELANNRVGNIIDRIFNVEDLTKPVQLQLKKFTYQAIDYLRMNDLVISEDVRLNQTSFNNGRTDSTQVNLDKIEQYVGSMAWRSWTLANIQDLYISWAKENNIPYLLDPENFYNKNEIDIKLTDIDDMIQVQQKMVDEKLDAFNTKMENRLTKFEEDLPNNVEFIENVTDKINEGTLIIDEVKKKLTADEEFKQDLSKDIATNDDFLDQAGTNLSENDPFVTKIADKLSDTVVTKKYVDDATLPFQAFKHTDGKTYTYQGEDFINMKNKRITILPTPSNDSDAATKKYVDTVDKTLSKALTDLKTNEVVPYQVFSYDSNGSNPKLVEQAVVSMNNGQFQALAEPTNGWHVATKKYVDSHSWIVGEIRPFEPESVVPAGWVKKQVEAGQGKFNEGFTLVARLTKTGLTEGQNLSHTHSIDLWDKNKPNEGLPSASGLFANTLTDDPIGNDVTDSDGNVGGNLAAGMYVDYYVYNPTKYAQLIKLGMNPTKYSEAEFQEKLRTIENETLTQKNTINLDIEEGEENG